MTMTPRGAAPDPLGAGVEYIIIGGVAASIHGSARATVDVPATEIARACGIECRLLRLDRLIEVKRAAGRTQDFEALAELETIRERRPPPSL